MLTCRPLEATRVKLTPTRFNADGYINANHVDGGAYILGQAPPPDAFGDWWQMVYEKVRSKNAGQKGMRVASRGVGEQAMDDIPKQPTNQKKKVSVLGLSQVSLIRVRPFPPLPWRLLANQGVRVIVCLTRLQEGDRLKADKYWPDVGQPIRFGRLVVALDDVDGTGMAPTLF